MFFILHFLYVMSIYFIATFDFCGKMLLACFNTENKILHDFNMNKEYSLVSKLTFDAY